MANLVAYYSMKDRAAQLGMTGESLAKNEVVLQGGLKSLEICKRYGIPVAYGSDLLGDLHWDQSKEFVIRQEVVSPIEIIRSATTIGFSTCCACRARSAHAAAGAPLPTSSWSTAIP